MLVIPRLLEALIASGRRPRDPSEASALQSSVASERVQAMAPEEVMIYLLPPPFRSMGELIESEPFWTGPMADPEGIRFDLALVIGHFGLGSDAPILLDYREDAANPRVPRLRWPPSAGDNGWVVMAPDFDSFVKALGL